MQDENKAEGTAQEGIQEGTAEKRGIPEDNPEEKPAAETPKVVFAFEVQWFAGGVFKYKYNQGITSDLDLLAKLHLTIECLTGKILNEQSYIPKEEIPETK
jgi:hypothetical protein